MSNWRRYAQAKEWWKIHPIDLGPAERVELAEILESVLPRVQRGHGMETFHDSISPRDAEDWIQAEAAELLQGLRRRSEETASVQGLENTLQQPIDAAIAELRKLGIRYSNWHSTYLYWDTSTRSWTQVDQVKAVEILAQREAAWLDILALPEGDRKAAVLALDTRGQAWNHCQPLHFLFRLDRFEVFTPLWHALNILNFHDEYSSIMDLLLDGQAYAHCQPSEVVADVAILTRASLEIGRSFEALRKKPMEAHALRGVKTLRAAQLGGSQRREPVARHGLCQQGG